MSKFKHVCTHDLTIQIGYHGSILLNDLFWDAQQYSDYWWLVLIPYDPQLSG